MPENLSLYQCFRAQPEGTRPAAQLGPEISAFINVLPRSRGGVAVAKSRPRNLNLYQCFLAACAFSAAWSIVAQIVHPGEIVVYAECV